MNAFADALTRKLKLQILSIYVYRYPINPLIKLDEPYGEFQNGKNQASPCPCKIKCTRINTGNDIFDWKSHILRSTNQENGKHDVPQHLDNNTVLVIMDWVKTFQPRKCREKQCEWFGKLGLSRHVSSVISKNDILSVQTFVQIIANSNQHWFSVASIVENLIQIVKVKNSQITKAFLRSGETGCYHNNMLILAYNDLSQSSSVQIVW